MARHATDPESWIGGRLSGPQERFAAPRGSGTGRLVEEAATEAFFENPRQEPARAWVEGRRRELRHEDGDSIITDTRAETRPVRGPAASATGTRKERSI